MNTIKNLMISALQAGNMEEVKRLEPEFKEEAAKTKWLNQFIVDGKGSIPVSAWLKPNPFIMFVDFETKTK